MKGDIPLLSFDLPDNYFSYGHGHSILFVFLFYICLQLPPFMSSSVEAYQRGLIVI